MTAEAPILELRDVEVSYGKLRALHGVSLRVNRGEVVALLGANGAGKTTTLRAISGLPRPSAGDITYEGGSIAGRRPDIIVRVGIAHSPEERHIWAELSVRENLSLGAYCRRDKKATGEQLKSVLARFPRLRKRLEPVGRHAFRR